MRTPRAAAIAGVAFSLPTLTSFGLLRSAIPADPQAAGGRLAADTTEVALALSLIPFAGIAFLWFIGAMLTLTLSVRWASTHSETLPTQRHSAGGSP